MDNPNGSGQSTGKSSAAEIGRALCRERGEISGGGGSFKKKKTAMETIRRIILIKIIRVSLGTVRHQVRFNIVDIHIQIPFKKMHKDAIGIRVNRATKKRMY